ncbi:hypothetical protein FXO38_04688 [Capsicum annuum]|nr:hypothetical protein FXO38_04688 [Capsicum annuum]KAF3678369.1 hypothetical protein FXO37_04408 [Capsicum annuum]
MDLPTEEESLMTSYITLGHVDTIADRTVELIRKELAGAIAIRRGVRQGQPNVEALHDQSTKADLGASSGGVFGVGGRHANTSTTHDDEKFDTLEKINMFENTPFHPYAGPSYPSSSSCSHYECEECKDSQDKIFEKVESISKDIKKFKSKRGVIPSKEGPFKKVEIYGELGSKEKRDLRQVKNAKLGIPDYPRPPLSPQDFQTMTYMRMWYEDKARLLFLT